MTCFCKAGTTKTPTSNAKNVTMNIRNIYKTDELSQDATCKESLHVQLEQSIARLSHFLNLHLQIAPNIQPQLTTIDLKFNRFCLEDTLIPLVAKFYVSIDAIRVDNNMIMCRFVIPATTFFLKGGMHHWAFTYRKLRFRNDILGIHRKYAPADPDRGHVAGQEYLHPG